MILSVSRRTDIPNYYSDWFLKRLEEQYVLVRNPMNIHQISRIPLTPDVLDFIVFWTKNPSLMLHKLSNIKTPFYFQFTLNSYEKDVEPDLPEKKIVIDTFRKLSDMIGKERIIWRYDPIFITPKYTIDYHVANYEKIAYMLSGYTEKCIISYIDYYKKIEKNLISLNLIPIQDEIKVRIAENLSGIAKKCGISINTCAEDVDLGGIGIQHACCVDDRLIEKILGTHINVKKDKNQRPSCGCVESIDIGLYNTCKNMCKYCYANYSQRTVKTYTKKYDVNSPLLCSYIEQNDIIKDRYVSSIKNIQIRMDI